MRTSRQTVLTILALSVAVFWLGRKSVESPDMNDVAVPNAELSQTTPVEPTPTPLPLHFPSDNAETVPSVSDSNAGFQTLAGAFLACWPNRSEFRPPESGELAMPDLEKLFGRVKKKEQLERVERVRLENGRERQIRVHAKAESSSETKWQVSVVEIDENGSAAPVSNGEDKNSVKDLVSEKAVDRAVKKWREKTEPVGLDAEHGLLFDDSLFKGGVAGSVKERDGRLEEIRIRADGRVLHCTQTNYCECL